MYMRRRFIVLSQPCPCSRLFCVRVPRRLLPFAPSALVAATVAKARGHFYAAAATQGFLVTVIAEAVCPSDDAGISAWQGCASHAIWTLVALQVDVLRFDIDTVYPTAAACYAAAVVCLLLVGRSGRRRCCSSFAKRAFEKRDTAESSDEEDDDSDSSSSCRDASPSPRFYGQSLKARLVWLTFYSESTSRVAMSVSSVSIQTTAILARVAFPAVVEIPCFQYVSSLPALLVARLCLEQLAACQAVRWPQPCGRWMFLFSGYTVCSMVLLLHFQTYIHQEDLCALHMMLAYSASMSSAAGAARPAWETHLAGLISAAILALPAGQLGQFDSALAWASLALMLGCFAATASFASSALKPAGVSVSVRRRRLRR
nr:uncharacterized protein LOC126539204 [Dermacentor andersoni]